MTKEKKEDLEFEDFEVVYFESLFERQHWNSCQTLSRKQLQFIDKPAYKAYKPEFELSFSVKKSYFRTLYVTQLSGRDRSDCKLCITDIVPNVTKGRQNLYNVV